MAVAFVALLAALSGSAVALPGTGSVDSGDIKNNTVKTKDIKNNNVSGKDVRNSTLKGVDVGNNSLTGADINESTLGKVPSAGGADTATNATNAANATRAASAGGEDGRTPFLVKLSAGQSQTIATNGAVSLAIECLSSGGNDIVRVLGATTQDGAAMGGSSNSYNGSAGNTLDTATTADDRELSSNSAADGTTDVDWTIDQGWVMAPDGKTLGLDGETTPLGVNFAGAECVASGVVNASG